MEKQKQTYEKKKFKIYAESVQGFWWGRGDTRFMALTKTKLAERIYEIHEDIGREQASEIVEAFLEIGKACLGDGEDLLFSGFGKFAVKQKNARRGRNPQTGKSMILDARRVVVFTPARVLRERVNGGW